MFKFVTLAALIAVASAGNVLPAVYNAGYVAPVASTYTAGVGGVSATVHTAGVAPVVSAGPIVSSAYSAPVVSAYSSPVVSAYSSPVVSGVAPYPYVANTVL